ncbi:MAG TPA: type II secretion system protein [Proteobacteria bacterium]|nr:type II secretion system protein [Pseudomonadota bacterium]
MLRKIRGFTLIELMVVITIIGILALIAIPNFKNIRRRAHDVSAQSAGRQAKLAEEMYYNDHLEDYGGRYTSAAADLIVYDRNIFDDPGVTFIWGVADDTVFTFTTTHKDGSTGKTYIFHD